MTENDYVELLASTGEISRLTEGDDGWWTFEGALDSWVFSTDAGHGFLTSFDPPDGPTIALGSLLMTARGRRLVVASILVKEQRLKIILMPEE